MVIDLLQALANRSEWPLSRSLSEPRGSYLHTFHFGIRSIYRREVRAIDGNEPMTVAELRDLLDGVDGNLPVLLASQPTWPMSHDLAARVEVVDGTAWLAEAGQLGYLPEDVTEELGW